MGNACCKFQTGDEKKPDETERLLDDANKGTDSSSKGSEEEPHMVQTGFKNEDEEEAYSNGTQDTRELGSEAQMAKVLTVVQVNQDVDSELTNLDTDVKKFPKDSSPVEDGNTPDYNQKIKEINVEDEGTGSGHVYSQFWETKHFEDPPKLEYLQVEPNTKRAEGGHSPSPASENVQGIDFSLKGESIKVAVPSLKSELEIGADPSFNSDPIKVGEPFINFESMKMEDHSLKSQPIVLKDPSFESEHILVVGPTLNDEPIEVVDLSLKKETVTAAESYFTDETLEAVSPTFEKETVEAMDPMLKKATVEAVDLSLKCEPLENAEPSIKNDPAEGVGPFLNNETLEAVDRSLTKKTVEEVDITHKNETVDAVDTTLKNETVDALDTTLKNETVDAVDTTLKNETVDAVDTTLKNETVDTVDTTLKNETADAVDTTLKNETADTVDTTLKNETAVTVDTTLKNETVDAVDTTIKNETVEAVDSTDMYEPTENAGPSIKNDSTEVLDPSLVRETVESGETTLKYKPTEDADPSIENDYTEVVDPSLNNETVEAVDTTIKYEPTENADLSIKNDHTELLDPSLNNETVMSGDTTLHYESTENADPSITIDPTEVLVPSLTAETIGVVEPSLKSPSLQSEEDLPATQDMKAEDLSPKAVDALSLGPIVVFPDEASAPTDHDPSMDNLSSAIDGPAQEDAAELVSSTHLEGEPEEKEHTGEGDAPAAVQETSDMNEDSPGITSSGQASDPMLVTGKSCNTEEEEPEGPEARMVELSDDIVQGVEEEELEQETRKDEGTGEDADESQEESVEDLYRAEEELALSKSEKTESLSSTTLPGVQVKSSVAPGVDILSYCQREWKGNTAKSTIIRKGYTVLSERFEGLQMVRGDNYCALRATLFQIFSHSDKIPVWMEHDDITLLPEKLAAEIEPVQRWKFPLGHEAGENGGAVERLKHHLKFLQKTWRAAAEAGGAEERRRLSEAVFRGGEEEHALLEAVKLLMLSSATELYARAGRGEEVPVFCWLLFARDGSESPHAFLANHLSQVGFGGGLEQVEMFLLGYTLQHTIQVYRLYMADTAEFITYYPDDHKEDWPQVCLVSEDDRHYNVLVEKLTGNDLPEAPTVA